MKKPGGKEGRRREEGKKEVGRRCKGEGGKKETRRWKGEGGKKENERCFKTNTNSIR